MYGRKQSIVGLDGIGGATNLVTAGGISGVGGGIGGAGPPGAIDYGLDETFHGEGGDVIWSSRNGPRKLLRLLSILR